MTSKTTPMKHGWRGSAKKDGGSSPSEQNYYLTHYGKREKRVRDKLNKLLKKLKKKYPNRKYELISKDKTTNRNKTTVYQIVRKDK